MKHNVTDITLLPVPSLPPRLEGRYHTYLLSSDWRKKRNKVIRRDGFRCSICGSEKLLEVHHLTYDHVFVEKLTELVTLCSHCHRVLHREAEED